jgi:hypothetical protein
MASMTHQSHRGTDIDNGPSPCRQHGRDLVLQAEEDAFKIDRCDLVECLFAHLYQGLIASSHAGVVDREIQPAVRLNDSLDEELDRGGVGHIGLDRQRLPATSLDLFRQVCYGLLTARSQHQLCSLLGEQTSGHGADPAAGAGDEGNLAREVVVCARLNRVRW